MSSSANLQICPSPFSVISKKPMSQLDVDLFKVYEGEIAALKRQNFDKKFISTAIQKHNTTSLNVFNKKTRFVDESIRIQTEQAKKILNAMNAHPVIGKQASLKYDPSGEIGFCFGRAAYAHIELMRLGVDPKNIAKVFVLGGLYLDEIGWDYHVATITQNTDGVWIVIDNLFNDILTLNDWMFEVARWDSNKLHPKLRYYFTDAAKFQPMRGSYDSDNFNSPIYTKYFEDLVQSYTNSSYCSSDVVVKKVNFFTCQK